MTLNDYSSWPWEKNRPRGDLISYVVYWTFFPMHLRVTVLKGPSMPKYVYMNIFNFLTSLGKQWSLPVPNWSVFS